MTKGFAADAKSRTDGQTWSPHEVLFFYSPKNT